MSGKRKVVHGERLVATIYGALNDWLVVPARMDWRPLAWPRQDGRDRYERFLTVLHCAAAMTVDRAPDCERERVQFTNPMDGGPCMSCGGNNGYGPAPHHAPDCYFASIEDEEAGRAAG